MKKISKYVLALAILAIVASPHVVERAQAWATTSQAPVTGNAPGPLHLGAMGQTKIGGLSLSNLANALLVPHGKFGIGILNPESLFEIAIPQSTTPQKPCTTYCTTNPPYGSAQSSGFYGYVFTPTNDGQITQLHLKGPSSTPVLSDVKLTNLATGVVLASATPGANGTWRTVNITPVNVTTGTLYSVTTSLSGGSGTGYYYWQPFAPGIYGNIDIRYGTAHGLQSYTAIYGLVDVTFVPVPSNTLFSVKDTGSVRIGAGSGASLFSVAGGIQIGADSAACTSQKAGTMRFQSSLVQVCNGSAWSNI